MKVTYDNIKELPISYFDKGVLKALLSDLEDINNIGKSLFKYYIDWQDYHNEYSPERTDPCPDFYGYYSILSEDDSGYSLGLEMTLKDLDSALCVLYNYLFNE